MYDLHDFRDITLLRVTLFKAFTSTQRVFLERLQNACRKNLICDIALLTCAHQEKKALSHWRTVFPPLWSWSSWKRSSPVENLSITTDFDLVTTFLLSALDDMHTLTTPFSSISAANHGVTPWFQNYPFYQALSCASFSWQDCAQLWCHPSGF